MLSLFALCIRSVKELYAKPMFASMCLASRSTCCHRSIACDCKRSSGAMSDLLCSSPSSAASRPGLLGEPWSSAAAAQARLAAPASCFATLSHRSFTWQQQGPGCSSAAYAAGKRRLKTQAFTEFSEHSTLAARQCLLPTFCSCAASRLWGKASRLVSAPRSVPHSTPVAAPFWKPARGHQLTSRFTVNSWLSVEVGKCWNVMHLH